MHWKVGWTGRFRFLCLRLFRNDIKNLIKRIFRSVNQNRLGLPIVCTITNKRLMMNVNNELGLHLSKNFFCAKKTNYLRVKSPPISHSSPANRCKQKLSRKMRPISFGWNNCSISFLTSSQWRVILLNLMNMCIHLFFWQCVYNFCVFLYNVIVFGKHLFGITTMLWDGMYV